MDGLRVLDLTQNLAGPYCTMLLADLGADVIEVGPTAGGGTGGIGPFTRTPSVPTAATSPADRGRRSIVLDLEDPVGRQTLLNLVPTVNVLVENGVAGVMDRLGLGRETLAAWTPSWFLWAVHGSATLAPAKPLCDMARLRRVAARRMGGHRGRDGHKAEQRMMKRCGHQYRAPCALRALDAVEPAHHR